jgi:uncharacterized membrane protein YebE (DUF533 family)
MDSLRTLRFWAAAAWADDELHPSEAAALRRLIEASELTSEERHEAEKLLENAPDVDLAEIAQLRPESREGIYRAARAIVRLDKVVTDDEKRFLATLRSALALDEATIETIDREFDRR